MKSVIPLSEHVCCILPCSCVACQKLLGFLCFLHWQHYGDCLTLWCLPVFLEVIKVSIVSDRVVSQQAQVVFLAVAEGPTSIHLVAQIPAARPAGYNFAPPCFFVHKIVKVLVITSGLHFPCVVHLGHFHRKAILAVEMQSIL